MTQNTNRDQILRIARRFGANMLERGQQQLRKSHSRHLVVRQGNGTKLVEVNLIVGVLLFALSLFTVPWLLMIVAFGGMMAKWRVEILRELDKEDKIIEMPTSEDNRE